MKTISVNVNNGYNVYVGKGIVEDAGLIIRKASGSSKFMIITNKKVYGLHGMKLKKSFKGMNFNFFFMKDGEEHKTFKTLTSIYDACIKFGLDRNSCIVAFGGGVTGDVAGFAAATYMRGIKYVQVPTTLLAQVDSSVGGKTGVDLKSGKNMVGAFCQPSAVIADTDFLKTLEPREFNNGMAEVIKHGIIADKSYFDYAVNNSRLILERNDKALEYIVSGSVKIKAAIVEADEFEQSGVRAKLNFGHTIGHAIETALGYRYLKHGEAVAIGAVMASKISFKTGLCDISTVNSINQAYNLFNLIKPLKKIKKPLIFKFLFNDKKAKDGKIRFVLTTGIGSVKLVDNVDLSLIKREIYNYFI